MPTTARSASCARSSATSRSCSPRRIEEIGATLEPGTAAAVLVWENTWAAPFGSAVRTSGGELLANGRIPTQALIAAVEADRQAAMKGA